MTAVKNRRNKVKLCKEDKIMYAVVETLMVLLVLIVLYPLIYVLSSSFSSGAAVSAGCGRWIFPRPVTGLCSATA